MPDFNLFNEIYTMYTSFTVKSLEQSNWHEESYYCIIWLKFLVYYKMRLDYADLSEHIDRIKCLPYIVLINSV